MWPFVAVWMAGCRAAVTLSLWRDRSAFPMYAVFAMAIHWCAVQFPVTLHTPHLQFKIQLAAFGCLMFGLVLLPKLRNLPFALLFVITAASYYSMPKAMWIRPWLMIGQAGCYVWAGIKSEQAHEPSEL